MRELAPRSASTMETWRDDESVGRRLRGNALARHANPAAAGARERAPGAASPTARTRATGRRRAAAEAGRARVRGRRRPRRRRRVVHARGDSDRVRPDDARARGSRTGTASSATTVVGSPAATRSMANRASPSTSTTPWRCSRPRDRAGARRRALGERSDRPAARPRRRLPSSSRWFWRSRRSTRSTRAGPREFARTSQSRSRAAAPAILAARWRCGWTGSRTAGGPT